MHMMAAGAYGLPQFRMCVFFWGACPSLLKQNQENICSTIISDFNSIQMTTSEFAKFPRERDLAGVKVCGNKVEWDPNVKRVYLESGKPLVVLSA
ncbi:hypothetical protein V6N13_061171 [Hibiscus sabdariffa]